MDQNRLTTLLFQTEALKVSPEDQPFWYTSGKMGPFYINTHYLYGGAESAQALLGKIDEEKQDPAALTAMLLVETTDQYLSEPVYRELCDGMADIISRTVDLSKIDYISGGERRDWFFSVQCARLLKKPHLSIFKDLRAVEGFGAGAETVTDLDGGRCLHIADLITEASSYERAWIPAIHALRGRLVQTFVVVDRQQGGMALLRHLGVEAHAMIGIDDHLFEKAFAQKRIDKGQLQLLQAYTADPDRAVREFLKRHDGFIEHTIAAGGKNAERAKLCLEKGFYR